MDDEKYYDERGILKPEHLPRRVLTVELTEAEARTIVNANLSAIYPFGNHFTRPDFKQEDWVSARDTITTALLADSQTNA